MNRKPIDYDDIVMTVEYRFTSFDVTLQQWIDKSMYKDKRWLVSQVRDKEGRPLSLRFIPKEYLYHENMGLSNFGVRVARLVSQTLSLFRK